jgi:hypothetical protein
MRRRCGVTEGDLLVEIEKMPPTRKQAAIDVITEMETEAKEKMEIMPGTSSFFLTLTKAYAYLFLVHKVRCR